jgi:RNAse (barnase) inhibitor barstar
LENKISKITFVSDPTQQSQRDAFQVVIHGALNKKDLLEKLSVSLLFPKYFGFNWDALSECLKDFSWIEQKSIVISHEEIPCCSEQELKTYLEILIDAREIWETSQQHSLTIFFPESSKKRVEKILKGIEVN